jgi:hypothetical protein
MQCCVTFSTSISSCFGCGCKIVILSRVGLNGREKDVKWEKVNIRRKTYVKQKGGKVRNFPLFLAMARNLFLVLATWLLFNQFNEHK